MKIHAFDFQSKDMIEDVYVAAVVAAVDFIWQHETTRAYVYAATLKTEIKQTSDMLTVLSNSLSKTCLLKLPMFIV